MHPPLKLKITVSVVIKWHEYWHIKTICLLSVKHWAIILSGTEDHQYGVSSCGYCEQYYVFWVWLCVQKCISFFLVLDVLLELAFTVSVTDVMSHSCRFSSKLPSVSCTQ